MVIIILWPSPQGTRYLIPIIPLYILYTIVGLTAFKIEKYIFLVITILTLLVYINAYRNIDYGPIPAIGTKETTDLFRFIEKHTNEKDVIIFRKPRVLSLYTNRRSSVYHEPKEDVDLWAYLKDIKAKYIIVAFNSLDQNGYLAKFIDKHKGHFENIYLSNNFAVYRIKMTGIKP